LVAETLGLPEAHVHGVATFYTQYYKEKKGKYVLDVCTCLSCQLCGGYDILHYLEDKLGIKKGETTEDGKFTLNEVECLGACGYAPMLQVTNDRYVNQPYQRKSGRAARKAEKRRELRSTNKLKCHSEKLNKKLRI
jgi:NADH:ubiquinone oxidoreductase subunit E